MSDGWTVYDPPLPFISNGDKILVPGMLLKLSCDDEKSGMNIILVGHINDHGVMCDCCSFEPMWYPNEPMILASKRIWTPEEQPR